jgi:hypothetical protein
MPCLPISVSPKAERPDLSIRLLQPNPAASYKPCSAKQMSLKTKERKMECAQLIPNLQVQTRAFHFVRYEKETAITHFSFDKNTTANTRCGWVDKAGSVRETVAINNSSLIIHNLLIVALFGKQKQLYSYIEK